MTTYFSKQDFLNTFKYYSGQKHQTDAVSLLYDLLPDDLKRDTADWMMTYRNVKPEPETPTESGAA